MMKPRISIVTLAVEDLERAVAFYEAMGLERHRKFTDGVAFFQMGGVVLALWPREDMARDVGFEIPAGGERNFPGVALAYNVHSPEDVAKALASAEKAGGRVLKSAQKAFWGGVQGYFEDTEGNVWEIAWNPDFPLDEEGRITLPE